MGYRRCNPHSCSAKQILYGLLKRGERCMEHRCSDDEDKIPARSNRPVAEPHRFSNAALGPVPVMRLADLLADHKSTPGTPGSISDSIQHQEWIGPTLSLAASPPKLLWTAQTLITAHRQTSAGALLAMATRDVAMLVAHRQLPTAFITARLQHQPAFLGLHPTEKAMLTAARNTFRFPGLTHRRLLLLSITQPTLRSLP
jgi:hypothetical protein